MKTIYSFTKISLFSIILFSSDVFSQDQIVSILEENWNNNQWDTVAQTDFTYDADGKVLIKLRQNYYNQEWINYSKNNSTYLSDGKISTEIELSWDYLLSEWEPYSRKQYQYTGNNMTSYVYEIRHNNVWVNESKYSYTYDANGFKIEQSMQSWNGTDWGNIVRDTFSNSASGQVVQSIRYDWHNNAWVKDYRSSYTYTPAGKVEVFLLDEYFNSEWRNYRRETSTFDNNGFLVNTIYEGQYNDDPTWYPLLNYDYVNYPDGKIHWQITQNLPNSSWQNVSKVTYFYGTAVLDLDESELAMINVFPNPAKDVLHVTFGEAVEAKITLTDPKGKVISSQVSYGNSCKFSLAELSSGIYFLHAEYDGQRLVQKFIKE